MAFCRFLIGLFVVLWLGALALMAIGTFGWFGQPQDPLAGVFVIILGSPWVQLASMESVVLALLMPGVNLFILWFICRLLTRRR
ncbi:hypothetical protein [Marimonas lutisalis]|uniref:hypothetical protein n=1 Tax=Marimonas lutisalis TaxID=2545756 RepID=UPI0010F89D6D|nr:hypothetical protein [Marimonas lutisalis]